MSHDDSRPVLNLAEFEDRARAILPRDIFDHVTGGADDEIALANNLSAFSDIRLVPRVLRDVTRRDLAATLLGEAIDFPVILAPVACLQRFHPEGELAAVRAAGRAGTIFTLSTGACHSLEEVAAAAHGPLWFQLYAYGDRGITQSLVERAEAAGYKALCLTVDVAISGRHERDLRNEYVYPKGLLRQSLIHTGFSVNDLDLNDDRLVKFAGRALEVSLTWEYLDWLRSLTRLPLLLKGILSTQDALRAVSSGVQGIVVSNHGGRQLDSAPAAIEVLPGIVEAVNGRVEVLMDGGVRRGTDALKALAMGAKAVLIGRPFVWALAADGQPGVEACLQMLRHELDSAMALTGCACLHEIDRELIWNPST